MFDDWPFRNSLSSAVNLAAYPSVVPVNDEKKTRGWIRWLVESGFLSCLRLADPTTFLGTNRGRFAAWEGKLGSVRVFRGVSSSSLVRFLVGQCLSSGHAVLSTAAGERGGGDFDKRSF